MPLDEQRRFLNDLVAARHGELARFVTILSRKSDGLRRLGNRLKVLTIVLGAFSASQGVAAEVFGKSSSLTSVGFALVGIAVAAIAGIEVAFKFETRSSELRMLAARCQAARFQHNSEWAHKIAIAKPGEAITAARDLLAIQDQALAEAQLEAARLGVNIATEEHRDLRGPESTLGALILDDARAALSPDTMARSRASGSDLPPPSVSPDRRSRSDEG